MNYASCISLGFCLYLESITGSYAQQGCCSHHGGEQGCVGNRVQCTDGTLSPTCMCGDSGIDNSLLNYTPAPSSSPPNNLYTILDDTLIANVTSHKSGTIYVWTDSQGVVHFSSNYPDKNEFVAQKPSNTCAN